jgi:hypothetical protein
MAGKEIDLDNIRQELIREQTAMWLVLKQGPEVTEETIDFYTEKANELLSYIVESSKKLGITPEIFIKSFKMGRF